MRLLPCWFRSTWNKMLQRAERVLRDRRDLVAWRFRARQAEAQLRCYDLLVVEHTLARATLRVQLEEAHGQLARYEALVGA